MRSCSKLLKKIDIPVHSFQKPKKGSVVEVLHRTHNLYSLSGIPEIQYQQWHFKLKTLLEETVEVREGECFMFLEFHLC
jgi:hypothetical protein